MLLSSETTNATHAFVEEELDPAHYELLAGMSVKLSGGGQGRDLHGQRRGPGHQGHHHLAKPRPPGHERRGG